MTDLKKMYKTVMDDHFPDYHDRNLRRPDTGVRKRTWKIDEGSGEVIEKGFATVKTPVRKRPCLNW